MALGPGSLLGSYEITARIGEGGMGEVYRAKDKNLGRDVAIKVLPEMFAQDAERLARFEREARTLASLNHPNIAIVHGFERPDGVHALIMEFVEGPTLADRIAQGALPVDEAMAIARQIAEALEAAHENGVVHRDLKPSNIKLRSDGTVKVLDFGLAKALDGSAANASSSSMSPTITTPALTYAGIILGTASYMSPEQAKGKAADRRADIWAFGVVLAEMSTGQQLFTGETTAEVLASVIKDEPRLDAVPASVRPIVQRCLRQDPRQRWQAIGDVRIAIEEGAVAPRLIAPSARTGRWWRSAAAAWIVASVGVASAIAVAIVHFRESPQVPPNVRFQVVPTEKAVIATFAVSPDGRHLAYRTRDADGPIWIRPMDSLDAQALPGTEGAAGLGQGQLFWSPDSEFVGFVAQGKLKKVSIYGGPPQPLVDAAVQTRGTWGRGGVILFVQGPASPIQRVPATGGAPVDVTKPLPGENHFFPSFLPDGRHFLYSVTGGKQEGNGIYVRSLDEDAPPARLLPDMIPARYAPADYAGGTGYLVFVREATLLAQRFNLDTLQLTGEVFPLAERVEPGSFSVSESGTLAFSSGAGSIRQQLVWFDRGGREIVSVGPPGAYGNFRLSHDEKRIAFNRFEGGNSDVWIFDLSRGVLSRISSQPGNDLMPTWSPDGGRVVWSSNRSGRFHMYGRAANGAGEEKLFLEVGALGGGSIDWSRDGRFVSYTRASEVGSADIWIAPQSTAGSTEQKPAPYLHSQFNEGSPAFSPDGRWVAYESDESGRQEIYIQAFPLTDQKYQISTGGGSDPAWRTDGTELFFLDADRTLMAVPVRARSATLDLGIAEALFPLPGDVVRRAYAPSADGKRFLVPRPASDAATVPVTVVLNWQSEIGK